MRSETSSSDRRLSVWRRGWLWWLPFLGVGLALIVDVALGGREPVSFVLTGVPPLVAATRGPKGTAVSAVVCLGLQMLLAARRPGHFDEEHHVALYAATLVIGVVSVLLAQQRERAQRHLIRANSVAEAMQRTLLRPVPPQVGDVRAAGYYTAGEGGTLVGGDLYSLCETPFGVRAVIGDVRGKGLDAVQAVAAVLGSFRVSAHEWRNLPDLADRLELSIDRNVPREAAGDPELFVTALVMELTEGTVRIVDCGHPPPIAVGPHGARPLDTIPELPLGLRELGPDASRTTEHRLHPGEALVVYTDGVSEARSAEGTFYPVLERLAARFRDGCAVDPHEVVSFLENDVKKWSPTSDGDDQAVLAMTFVPREPA
ncbi:PP2C family protein-serine/threonine phosphatase [Streptomyces sp. NPDC058579]|uniref:PP2C family protein-serine/threonine phosphatase n=1 Tax=Streptomyces sp. NPDC058579 TaxID=3346548 RepID=UPI003649FD91